MSRLVISFLLAAAATASGASIQIATTDGSGGISGQLRYDDGSSFGVQQWHVKNAGLTASTRKGYVRFDTSSVLLSANYAALDLTVSLIAATIGNADQTISVYGITNQVLDNVALTNLLPWADGPANNAASADEADLNHAELLGEFQLDYNGDYAAPSGTVIRFTSDTLADFINSDTNGIVTFVLGRTAASQEDQNLLFAGEGHPDCAAPTLVVDDLEPRVVNTSSYWSSSNQSAYTNSFAAGAADKLIVSLHYEAQNVTGITYSGTPLTMVPGSAAGPRTSIWCLDGPYTGGAADIVVSLDAVGSQVGLGIVSVAGIGTGFEDVATASGTNSLDLAVTIDNSFVFVGFGVNQATAVTARTPPLARIAITGADSMAADAGYQHRASSGTHTYSCTAVGSPLTYYVSAVAFSPIQPRGTLFTFE